MGNMCCAPKDMKQSQMPIIKVNTLSNHEVVERVKKVNQEAV